MSKKARQSDAKAVKCFRWDETPLKLNVEGDATPAKLLQTEFQLAVLLKTVDTEEYFQLELPVVSPLLCLERNTAELLLAATDYASAGCIALLEGYNMKVSMTTTDALAANGKAEQARCDRDGMITFHTKCAIHKNFAVAGRMFSVFDY